MAEKTPLEELEGKIENYASGGELSLPRSRHAVVKLGRKTKYIDICVLSNIQVGLVGPYSRTSKDAKPFRIKKLKAHIEEIKNNPNARVILGGDLFYFPEGGKKAREAYSPSYQKQAEILAELLEPIKSKIVGAIDGTEEIKIFEKDGINTTKMLLKNLDLKGRYFGQMAEIDFMFRSTYTNERVYTIHTLFDHGFLAANVMSTVAKKTEGLQNKINGKDFYFTSHYNKIFIEKTATLYADNGTHMIKKPCYFISVGGYRDYPNKLSSNRNTSPTNTDNGMIRIFAVQNPDRNNIRGNDYLGEPQFKVCQEFINFGRTASLDLDYNLMEEIAKLNAENTVTQEILIKLIKEKIGEINKENADILINGKYGKDLKEELEKVKNTKIITKQTEDVIEIDEEGGKEKE